MAPKKKVLKEDWKSTANTVADYGQIGLDVAGAFMDPAGGAGAAIDATNAVIYALRGNYLNAAFSIISTVPFLGDAIGKGTKFGLWVSKNMPKTASTIVKIAPEIAKAKDKIRQAVPLIKRLFATIQKQSSTDPVYSKLAPHLPQMWSALDAFLKSPNPQSGNEQPQQPQVAAEAFSPSLASMLFEDHDISDVIEKAAKTKDKSEKTNLLKKYHLMRNDGDQEPTNVGEPGDTTTGDHLFNQIFESNEPVIVGGISSDEAKKLAAQLEVNFNSEGFDFSDFLKGANHEIEHAKTVNKSPGTIAKIALDHLKEDSKYYDKLTKMEAFAPKLKDFL